MPHRPDLIVRNLFDVFELLIIVTLGFDVEIKAFFVRKVLPIDYGNSVASDVVKGVDEFVVLLEFRPKQVLEEVHFSEKPPLFLMDIVQPRNCIII